MMKLITKILWPLFMIGLTIFFLITIIFFSIRHSIVKDQLTQLGESIHTESIQWENIKIEKQDPIMFHKDLTINHDIESIAANTVIISASVLIVLALTTAIWQYKKKLPNK